MGANRHRLHAIIFALLQMALSLGTAANLVVCRTTAGHVAVESAFSADCCADPPLAKTFGPVHADDGCGCVDTPLLQSPMELRSRLSPSAPQGHALVLPGFAAIDVGAESRHQAAAYRPPTPGPTLVARRSVVLLV